MTTQSDESSESLALYTHSNWGPVLAGQGLYGGTPYPLVLSQKNKKAVNGTNFFLFFKTTLLQ